MDSLSYKTISANKATAKKEWILVDAENEINRLRLQGAYRGQETERSSTRATLAAIGGERDRMRIALAAAATGG